MKKVKIIKIKPMNVNWVNDKHDTDNDGIPNYFDCNPWNPNEQGFLHDAINKVKDRRAEVKQMKEQRRGKEAYFDAAKEHVQVESDIQRQIDDRNKPVYLYVKMGDPRLKGGLRWHFIGGYEQGVISQVVRELSKRGAVYGVESSYRSDMESYLNRRDFKEAAKQYVKERNWKENVKTGLKTKEEQERMKRLKQYQRVLATERAITGAPQMFVHSGNEFINIIRGPKRRKY